VVLSPFSLYLRETRKLQKRPPTGREGVNEENSNFRGKNPISEGKNTTYVDCYQSNFVPVL
jgi:hypothetical protein